MEILNEIAAFLVVVWSFVKPYLAAAFDAILSLKQYPVIGDVLMASLGLAALVIGLLFVFAKAKGFFSKLGEVLMGVPTILMGLLIMAKPAMALIT